ncbi:hypothetical protein IVB18_31085 [Bradyrhizobium sp. 186]|uniref:hypothetical protein n=1 Tax=Bradyrhizobium sp. 186 TaxID=2782654 RepID=UPI002001A176|nr:hypothetical protein [Bradyrhizobium sp. 186]UPK32688.1 hypothetical protein IVB18_31085 [Bradyrhizobium sp. 186]
MLTSASEAFGIRNNNKNLDQLIDSQRALAAAYKDAGVTSVVGYVFTAFGCNYEGEIPISLVIRSMRDLLYIGEQVRRAQSCARSASG